TSFTLLFTAPPSSYIYPLSLHDALPILILRIRHQVTPWNRSVPLRHFLNRGFLCSLVKRRRDYLRLALLPAYFDIQNRPHRRMRSEEHTSELQSRVDLVCRLLLEKKKKT